MLGVRARASPRRVVEVDRRDQVAVRAAVGELIDRQVLQQVHLYLGRVGVRARVRVRVRHRQVLQLSLTLTLALTLSTSFVCTQYLLVLRTNEAPPALLGWG